MPLLTGLFGKPDGGLSARTTGESLWIQTIAREMNLSETVFVVRDGNRFGLRSPNRYRYLRVRNTCSCHIRWEERFLEKTDPAHFFTAGRTHTAQKEGDLIELDFPAIPEEPAPAPAELSHAHGIQPGYTGKNRFGNLIEVLSEHEVRNIAPDFSGLSKIPMRGSIVSSRASTPGLDFVSWFFTPFAGVNEDPVTGSAHCCFAQY
jgi:predicted PhzF superfamily epimerase YddE/YHI9